MKKEPPKAKLVICMKHPDTNAIFSEAVELITNTESTEDEFDNAVNDIARRLKIFMNDV